MHEPMLEWAREIEYEDLLEGDLRLIHEYCGPEVVLSLLSRLKGHTVYISASPLTEMKRRFIREHQGELSPKEMAVRLDCSQEFVYRVLRGEDETPETPEIPDAPEGPSLFDDTSN